MTAEGFEVVVQCLTIVVQKEMDLYLVLKLHRILGALVFKKYNKHFSQ